MIFVSRLLPIALLITIAMPCVAQPGHAAVYSVTFDATWSMATHPTMFPPNPHFSRLIGGTHDDQVDFWSVGDFATLGIRRMAEWGSTSPLDQEIETAIVAGHAGEIIMSDSNPVSPGMVTTTFTVTPESPLATIVTMIAPSPDWFTGVDGLDLRNGDDWVETLAVDVFPFDAGTDSGVSYTSPDQLSIPQELITAIIGAPFTPGEPLGVMTFTLLTSATDVPALPALELTAYPNPFNPSTTVVLTIPFSGPALVTIHDLRGHVVRTLLDGVAAAGRSELSWNGRTEQGRSLSSGVYLVRAKLGERTVTRRLTLGR